MVIETEQLTPREHMLMEHEAEQAKQMREHAVRIKELELALAREKYQAEIELRKLESKWGSWLRIPSTIIKLPVFLIFAVGYVVAVATKQEPSKSFWSLLN